jgi:predicted DNA-binding transcriptional regulator AlpA
MLYNTKDIMNRYNISRATIYNWQKKIGFPPPFMHGRWHIKDLEEWEESRRVEIKSGD